MTVNKQPVNSKGPPHSTFSSEPKNGNGSKGDGAHRRVLIVDDEQLIADTLAAILRHAGYETSACYDGHSALLRCDSFLPELVITDVVMPGMSGVELAVTLSGRFPECKVLLFSGQASTVDYLEKARSDGHDFEVLAKPIHPTELLARIAKEAAPSPIARGESRAEESCA